MNITSAALALLALSCFALSPTVNAVNPPPAGGYPNENTAEGDYALFSLTTGAANTAIGSQALSSNTTASENTAVGRFALGGNTTGFHNTATGASALLTNVTGSDNTATGAYALLQNLYGSGNTATGYVVLERNTTGSYNTATGAGALASNITGSNNTATGANALFSNTIGIQNTATGFNALRNNTAGNHNTANGFIALQSNTTGNYNTASGQGALNLLTSGSSNTADGQGALKSLTTGSNNVALGFSAGQTLTTGSNNIDIGNFGAAGDTGVTRIGKSPTTTATFIAGISGKAVANGVGVIVNSSSQLGTILSSARFKTDIKPMDKASEAILALSPVTFRYKQDVEPDGVPQFGLIAEEVEKVNPDLVVRDEDGKVTTVRYDAVNAMLLNEFLKEHRRNEEQQAMISELKLFGAQQQKQIEGLTASLQKVSAQLELTKAAPQTVLNNQ